MSLIAAAMMTTTFTACSSDDDNNTTDPVTPTGKTDAFAVASQAITENYLSNVVYPIYTNLANTTSELYDALNSNLSKMRAGTLTQSDINNACDKFLEARSWWECSEAFLYGPATTFGIDPHIDTWPLDLDGLAVALSNSAMIENLEGEDGIAYAGAKLGQELLGFHGIEFILFRDGDNRTLAAVVANETDEAFAGYTVTGEMEMMYAVAVAGDLRDRCYQLEVAWEGDDASKAHRDRVEECEYEVEIADGMCYGENMLAATKSGSTFSTWNKVLTTIFSGGCSNICNEVANSKMGNAYTGEDVSYIESPYSKRSFVDFYDNILSIRYSLYGTYTSQKAAEASLITLLKEDDPELCSRLEDALEDALKSLETCMASGTAFVDNYTASWVGNAIDEINELDAVLQECATWASKLQ